MRTEHAGSQSWENERIDEPSLEEATQAALKAYRTCVETMPYCLVKGGKYAEPAHVLMLRDCAHICQVAAEFMMTGSFLYRYTCRACAEICSQCEESCRDFGQDRTLQRCADSCAKCADSCRSLAEELTEGTED